MWINRLYYRLSIEIFIYELQQNVGSIRLVASDCLTKIYDTVALNVIQNQRK